MRNITALTKKAINSAKNQDWQQAVELNQQLVEINSKDLGALNRLAMAYIQLDDTKKAKHTLEQVLLIDKHNKIAKKNLGKLKKNHKSQLNLGQESFIEEPGKAKNFELIRVADDQILDEVSVGQTCQLDPKSAYISINTVQGNYLGTLPKEISQRLISLIKTGNQYSCSIQTCQPGKCVVHLRETKVSAKNKGLASFAFEENNGSTHPSIEEFHEIEEAPLEIVETDTDVEVSEIDVSKIQPDNQE
ncbi:MAG: tetratricopeptide repeat protein [Candidatus Pacebacteria bacterium]|nr:tetratricopeptide repeat protein [Candidatus Paceibacterota bacterium]